MVIIYTEDELNTIFDNPKFLSDYDTYKSENHTRLNMLNNFFSELDPNKKYHKISINKNKKYQSEETTMIKNINNLLNKITDKNTETIKNEILSNIKTMNHILPLIIDSIIDQCILQINFMDNYINILVSLVNLEKCDININIEKQCKSIYIENNNTLDYDGLCELNSNIDKSIGLSILIVKLELNNIIQDRVDNTILKMFENIVLDDEDICYKYILSLYNIFDLLDKSYIVKYKEELEKLQNSKISKKNKFKIMDILEKV